MNAYLKDQQKFIDSHKWIPYIMTIDLGIYYKCEICNIKLLNYFNLWRIEYSKEPKYMNKTCSEVMMEDILL